MTPSLPTLSMASAIIWPISGSAAEMDATWAICSLVSAGLARSCIDATAASTAVSMPFFIDMGFAPAATFLRPSRTMAHASTVAVVVPSPATSSVFFATSLTSSAPIFSKGSSRSMSLAIETPSFVMVGAPHFLSSTTLRPLGPRVTRTASASLFIPRSRARRASSSKAISFATVIPPSARTSLVQSNVSSLLRRVLTGPLAPRHRRHQGNRLAGLGDRVEAVKESNVLVGNEDVHEAPQSTLVVEDARGDAGAGDVHGPDGFTQRGRLHGHFADPADQGTQLARQSYDDTHEAATNWSKRRASSAA